MGACGCGNFNANFKFKGPGDSTYVFQLYAACSYCNTPAGVILYKMSPEDCADWCVDDLPDVEIRDVGTLIGVVDPGVLLKELSKSWEDMEYAEPDFNVAFSRAENEPYKELNKMLKELRE